MIILSLDSGVEKTGFAVFDKNKKHQKGYRYLASGLILTSTAFSPELRLNKIYQDLQKVFSKYRPSRLIIEELFLFKNHKTVIKVSRAQGVAMLLAAQNNTSVSFLTPLQIKQIITGYGQADKKSVQKMLKLTLNLDGELKQDDQADAIACGLAYCFMSESLI